MTLRIRWIQSPLAVVIAAGSLSTACGPKPPTIEPKLSEIQTKIFNPTCATSSCHSTGSMTGQLDLSEGHAFVDLVNVLSKNVGPAADGILRVKPGDPVNSLLYIKVAGHTPVAYGTNMPQVGALLGADSVQAIHDWIADGAPNN